MSELKKYKLGELGIFYGGVTSIKREDYGFGTPFLQYKNVYKNWKVDINNLELMNVNSLDISRKSCIYGDIFFTAASETEDEVAMSSVLLDSVENLTFNGFCKRFRLFNFNILLPEYGRYLFRSKQFRDEVYQVVTGDIRFNISQESLANIEIIVPSIIEQKAIATMMSILDDKIDLLQKQNMKLEKIAETLFRQWFVEEAKDEWQVGTLEDEFDFTMGQSPLGSELNENGIGIIFYQGRTDFGFRFPKLRVYTTAPTRFAKKFDTLVSVRAPVGDMNMAIEECCLGRGVAAFRYKYNNQYYSYSFYKMHSLMQQIKQFEDNGCVFGCIGKEDFKKLENILPPKELIEDFQEKAKPFDDKIFSNTIQIHTLSQLRNSLLPKLMSGELTVEV